MKKAHIVWTVLGIAVLSAAALTGTIMSNVEQARYSVVRSGKNIEIRDYPKMIVAEVTVSGERKEAIKAGFRIIADYIFGNNIDRTKIAMTAPVTQESGQKIAMTAPVTQQAEEGGWVVRFVMPAAYSLSSLPQPKNTAIQLKEIPARRFAVIRFSGLADTETLKEQETKLRAWLETNHLPSQGHATYAFFNPPWTLPFLRRNEVMIEIR